MLTTIFRTILALIVAFTFQPAICWSANVRVIPSTVYAKHYQQSLSMKDTFEAISSRLHKDLKVVFAECGQINAFYQSCGTDWCRSRWMQCRRLG